MTAGGSEASQDIVERMLAMVDAARYRIDTARGVFAVAIAGITIAFDQSAGSIDRPLEQLATAIESDIAFGRAQAMLIAADATTGPLPLWLVTGSSVLASWLSWSRTDAAFRRKINLSDQLGAAPISGLFARPARHALGQTAAKIRVRGGFAVAERIDLPGRIGCTASLGREAQIRIEGNSMPATILAALDEDPSHNDRRRVADLVEHPFFTSTDLRLAGIRNDGSAVLIDVESRWAPLAEVPKAAWSAVPRDANLTCPWRATISEVAELYRLVDAGRRHTDPA